MIIENADIHERFFNERNFMEIEDFYLIGDEHISVGVPRYIPEDLKKRILAAIKSMILGNSSVDNVLKKHGDKWKFETYDSEKDKLLAEIFRCVRNQVGTTLSRMIELKKINTNGLIVSRAVLFRLQNSFKSVLLLIRRRYYLEAMNLCRLILEQIAWVYVIHKLNEKEILKTNVTKSISKLKEFYHTAGTFYGNLSKYVHISPELTPAYINIDGCECKVVLSSAINFSESLYNILVLTDIYCCTIEFVYRDLLEDFFFLNAEDKLTIDSNREFKKDILLYEELLF